MDESELENLRNKLIAMREELVELETTLRLSAAPVELDQSRVGRLSRLEAMQDQQLARETARRRAQELDRIEKALRRVDAGEYGACFVCHETIDRRRLAIDPTHTRCVGCVDE